MGPLSFTNPALLGGLAALALPILIHLLLKRRRLKVRFSTLRFFQAADQRARQRRRLRQWLLLAARLLAVTLLVAAFARPYLARTAPSRPATRPLRVALILDRSASMSARDSGGLRWERALAEARARLARLQPGDTAALIEAGSPAQVLLPLSPPAEVLRRLERIEPGFGAADLGDALGQADSLLAGGTSAETNEVWVASDLQRNSCVSVPLHPLRRDAALRTLAVGDGSAPNAAVTGLQCGTGLGVASAVTLTSFAEDALEGRLRVLLDGKAILDQALNLRPGSVTNLPLSLTNLAPGWHSAQAGFECEDSLALDNTRYAAFYAASPTRVLVVEPRKNVRPFQEESLFLAKALNPGGAGEGLASTGFLVDKCGPEDLASRLRGAARPSVVMVPGLPQLPGGAGVVLGQFVREGGGLVLFVGEGLSPREYNRELAELLPAPLRALDRETRPGWRLQEFDPDSPIFAPFRTAEGGNLALPEFTRRFLFSDAPETAVVARFHDGVPALMCRQVGNGKVLLVNTSADTTWTDWPRHRTFVPWVHGMAHFLSRAGDAGPKSGLAAADLVAGQEAELEGFAPGQALHLRGGAAEVPLRADAAGQCVVPGTLRPGIWSMTDEGGPEIRRLAVNLPAAESDLAAMPAREFEESVRRREAAAQAGIFASGGGEGRKEYDGLMLAGLLGLLLAELALANRTLS
jgi:hypothetical protein